MKFLDLRFISSISWLFSGSSGLFPNCARNSSNRYRVKNFSHISARTHLRSGHSFPHPDNYRNYLFLPVLVLSQSLGTICNRLLVNSVFDQRVIAELHPTSTRVINLSSRRNSERNVFLSCQIAPYKHLRSTVF